MKFSIIFRSELLSGSKRFRSKVHRARAGASHLYGMAEIVCPGKRLGRVSEFQAGPGTYVRGDYIYAGVLGPKEEQKASADEGANGKPFIVVRI